MQRITRDKVVPHGQRYRVEESVATVDPGETIVVETINHMTPVVRSEADLHDHGTDGYQENDGRPVQSPSRASSPVT